MNMYDKLAQAAHDFPHVRALSLNGKHITFLELMHKIDESYYKCLNIGIKPHDKVALILPNIFENVYLLYALNKLNVTVVMIHPLSAPAMIKKRLEFVGAKKAFVLDVLMDRYHGFIDDHDMIIIGMAHNSRGIEKLALNLRYGLRSLRQNHFNRISSAPSKVEAHKPIKDAVVLFSSGTMGEQKAIGLSSQAFNTLAFQMRSNIEPVVGEDSMYCVLPFFHGFGLGVTLHGVLALGGRCVLVPRIKRNTMVKELLKEKPTHIAGVPYLFRILLSDETFLSSDLSFIKDAFVGGEAVAPKLVEDFNALLKKHNSPGCMRVGYGMTEATAPISISESFDETPYCVGYPLIGNQIMILKENEKLSKPYEYGEICVSGKVVMNGYLNNDQLNAKTLRYHGEDLYYHTGDIGYMDEKGRLYFSHRLDELIKVKGYFVNPLEVETQLYKIPGCIEAKVFVSGDETLSAMMVFDRKYELENLIEITNKVMIVLDRWSIPKQYYVVKDIPKNDMRKYDIKRINTYLKSEAFEFIHEWKN